MDCLDAQRAISEALDREPVDAFDLEDAKQHCRECADCAAFVRALNLVKNAPEPEVPADLADRVMARVRAEAAGSPAEAAAAIPATAAAAPPAVLAAAAAPDAAGASAPGAVPAPTAPAEGTPRSQAASLLARMLERAKRPENRTYVIAYTSAAAVFLIFLVAVGVAGVREITSPYTPAISSTSMSAPSAPRATQEAAPSGAQSKDSAVGGNGTAGSTYSGAAAVSPAPSDKYVLFNGVVYRYTAPSKDTSSSLTQVGTVTSALADPTAAPTEHVAYTGADGALVIDNSGQLWSYARVTRTYNGVTYELASAPLERYGVWPTMPSPLQPPTSSDGSPGFTKAGTSVGISVFTRVGDTAEAGIAVPPNTPPSDPAAANPNWTWWAPKK